MSGKGKDYNDSSISEDVLDEHRYKNPVGYKNPPKEHQWKKGQSGNPKGRPKVVARQPSLYEMIYNICGEYINIHTQSGEKEVKILEAIARKFIQKTLESKNPKEMMYFIRIHELVEKRLLKNEILFEDDHDEIGVLQRLVLEMMVTNEDEVVK